MPEDKTNADEPVVKVDKRKTRRQKREEEAGAQESTAPAVEAPAEATEPVPEVEPPMPEETAAAAEAPLPADEVFAEAEAEGEEAPADPFAAVDVHDHVRFLIPMFVNMAWIHLGVQAPPGAGETRADLPQARLAIDLVAMMKEKMGDNLQPEERNQIEMMLSNLRVNYLQRLQKGE